MVSDKMIKIEQYNDENADELMNRLSSQESSDNVIIKLENNKSLKCYENAESSMNQLDFQEFSDNMMVKVEDNKSLECDPVEPELVYIKSELNTFKLENQELVIKQEDGRIDFRM